MGKRKGTEAPNSAAEREEKNEKNLLSDDFDYQVAEMAWRQGLSPNEIAKRLNMSDKIMQVKRGLQKAISRGILRLHLPPADLAREQLKRILTWKVREYVVVDDTKLDQKTSVCLAAAEKFVEVLESKLLESRKSQSRVVVGVAGGYTVSQMVRFARSMAPQLDADDCKRLMFISLHAAVLRRRFHESANFLAVRLAEIFGGEHFAVLEHVGQGKRSQEEENEYSEYVKKMNVLIAGLGSPKSLVGRHAEESNITLPAEMVGDLAYIPLDVNGRWVEDSKLKTALSRVRPQPSYAELIGLKLRGMDVIMIVGVFAHGMDSKLRITRAVLRAGLASICVMGHSFASRLVEFGDKTE